LALWLVGYADGAADHHHADPLLHRIHLRLVARIATTLLRDNVIRFTVGLFVFTLLFALGTVARIEATVPRLVMWAAAILGLISIMAFLFLIKPAPWVGSTPNHPPPGFNQR
jgi:uncharacterized membrane protein